MDKNPVVPIPADLLPIQSMDVPMPVAIESLGTPESQIQPHHISALEPQHMAISPPLRMACERPTEGSTRLGFSATGLQWMAQTGEARNESLVLGSNGG
jgi:hypothetical protein